MVVTQISSLKILIQYEYSTSTQYICTRTQYEYEMYKGIENVLLLKYSKTVSLTVY